MKVSFKVAVMVIFLSFLTNVQAMDTPTIALACATPVMAAITYKIWSKDSEMKKILESEYITLTPGCGMKKDPVVHCGASLALVATSSEALFLVSPYVKSHAWYNAHQLCTGLALYAGMAAVGLVTQKCAHNQLNKQFDAQVYNKKQIDNSVDGSAA